jgi:hypothetical protein
VKKNVSACLRVMEIFRPQINLWGLAVLLGISLFSPLHFPLTAGDHSSREDVIKIFSTEMEILGSGKTGNTPSHADQPRAREARAIDEFIFSIRRGLVRTRALQTRPSWSDDSQSVVTST